MCPRTLPAALRWSLRTVCAASTLPAGPHSQAAGPRLHTPPLRIREWARFPGSHRISRKCAARTNSRVVACTLCPAYLLASLTGHLYSFNSVHFAAPKACTIARCAGVELSGCEPAVAANGMQTVNWSSCRRARPGRGRPPAAQTAHPHEPISRKSTPRRARSTARRPSMATSARGTLPG